MTFPDLIKELISSSTSRIKHPILASFITSWILYNWDSILIVLLSESSISDRIIIAKATYAGKEGSFYIPVIFAFAFVLVLPYLSLTLDYLRKKAKSIKRKRNDDLQKSKLELEKDLAIFRYEIAQNESGQKTTEEFIQKIESLAEEKRAIEKINSEQRDQLTQALEEIKAKNDEIIKLNRDIARINEENKLLSETNHNEVIEKNKHIANSDRLEYDLDQLKTLILRENKKADSQFSKYLKVRDALSEEDFNTMIKELTAIRHKSLSKEEFNKLKSSKLLEELKLIATISNDSIINPFLYRLSNSGLNFIKFAEAFGDTKRVRIKKI